MLLSWNFDGLNYICNHLVCRSALHFLFRREGNTMPQYNGCYINNIIRQHKITSTYSRQCLRTLQNANRCTRRSAEVNRLMIAGTYHDRGNKTHQFSSTCKPRTCLRSSSNLVGRQYRVHRSDHLGYIQSMMIGNDSIFFFRGWIANIDLEQEPVQLCFRKPVSSFLFNRVLSCQHHNGVSIL